MFCLYVYMQNMYVPGSLWDKKRMPSPLEMESQLVLIDHMGTANQPRSSERVMTVPKCWTISPALIAQN